jgi:hypothetical protein
MIGMSELQAEMRVTSTLSAVVHHADETVEDLGVISTSQVEPKKTSAVVRLFDVARGVHHGRR